MVEFRTQQDFKNQDLYYTSQYETKVGHGYIGLLACFNLVGLSFFLYYSNHLS